jgi:hypothetical protein
VDVVGHLLAVQAQDARMLPWALRARGGSADGCVITWLMRSTLHLVRVEDVRWLLALTEPRQRAGNARRLRQLGIDGVAERAVRRIARVLQDGPLTRAALAERLDGIPVDGQRIAHLTHRAALDGVIALTPDRELVLLDEVAPRRGGPAAGGDRATFRGDGRRARPAARGDRATFRGDGLRPPAGVSARRPETPSLADFGARYRAAHPRASPADLARWSGLPLAFAREALRDAPEPRPRRGELGVSLLPAFDELLLGYVDRTPTVPAEYERLVYPGGGILRAVVLCDGVATGTWRLRGGEVSVERFPSSRPASAASP